MEMAQVHKYIFGEQQYSGVIIKILYIDILCPVGKEQRSLIACIFLCLFPHYVENMQKNISAGIVISLYI